MQRQKNDQTEAWNQYKTSAGISGLNHIQEETEIHVGQEKVEA